MNNKSGKKHKRKQPKNKKTTTVRCKKRQKSTKIRQNAGVLVNSQLVLSNDPLSATPSSNLTKQLQHSSPAPNRVQNNRVSRASQSNPINSAFVASQPLPLPQPQLPPPLNSPKNVKPVGKNAVVSATRCSIM